MPLHCVIDAETACKIHPSINSFSSLPFLRLFPFFFVSLPYYFDHGGSLAAAAEPRFGAATPARP
jgi:hypothetical protein